MVDAITVKKVIGQRRMHPHTALQMVHSTACQAAASRCYWVRLLLLRPYDTRRYFEILRSSRGGFIWRPRMV